VVNVKGQDMGLTT